MPAGGGDPGMATTDMLIVHQECAYPIFGVTDTRIVGVSEVAAVELFGAESPDEIVGRYSSEFVPRDIGRLRRINWYKRMYRGGTVRDNYLAPLIGIDGKTRHVTRAYDRHLSGPLGASLYITRLKPVKEVDYKPVSTDLEAYHIDPDDFYERLGISIAELGDILADPDAYLYDNQTVAFCNQLGDIIEQNGGDIARVFSADVSLSVANGQIQARYIKVCPHCGHRWYARSPTPPARGDQCTRQGCRLYPDSALAKDRMGVFASAHRRTDQTASHAVR